ncbi:glycosyl transferase family 2 [Gramella sp. Hel_I_59]|uniref:glycosyltransferase family 2 protein n=1 Tax=Gramella sp. Hel_I_59 TaxID=1249978 RepID=UPI0011536DE1|nr:glycosyltransferase family A protein [Gramella sp. Hel_I_59]TQI71944.1 glycosyl transferase family 2 [Gramella sp. Hel_I_59]
MAENLVSVIIPNFNSIKFIEATLDSVFNQTYKNIEIIIIDDGSTDGSFEYISNLDNQNIKLLKSPGKGACAARNYGLRLAKGEFIQFLDADDLFSPNKIESQVSALRNQPESIAVCSTKHFYETIDKGVITDREFLYTTSDTEAFLLNLYGANGQQNMVQTSAWLTPRILLDKVAPWDETLSKDQDGEYFCRVVTTAKKVIYTPETVNYYRKHIKGSNIANQRQQIHLESQIRALDSKTKQFVILKDSQAYNNAMALQYKIIAIDAYPMHKTIYKAAIHKTDQFGGSTYEPVMGGKIIESIKAIFGWRAAKSFSVFIHKYVTA